MSQLSFDEFDRQQASSSNAGNNSAEGTGPRVGFFSLKNDGDEAIVRIMHDSTRDFDMLNVHRVTVDGKSRNVNCNRGANDPAEACPLCAAGSPISKKIYIHLLEYVRNAEGVLVPVPKVWERSASYAYTLRDYIQDYGPLSDCLFKIKRKGAPGSRDTSYTFIYCRPEVYKEENYPKLQGAFDGYKAAGSACIEKDYNGLQELVPNIIKPDYALRASTPASTYSVHANEPVAAPVVAMSREEAAPYSAPAAPQTARPATDTMPWSTAPRAPMSTSQGYDIPVNRPRRTF